MKLRAEITDIARLMADEVKAGEKAVHFGIRDAGAALKDAWRQQVVGAGLGQRLARTIRSETWPKHKNSLNAAAMVWTRAPVLVVRCRWSGSDTDSPVLEWHLRRATR